MMSLLFPQLIWCYLFYIYHIYMHVSKHFIFQGYCFHGKSKHRQTKQATLIVEQRESAGVFTIIILELYIVMRNLRRG